MPNNKNLATKEQRRKAAQKNARNTISWHALSAIGMLFLLFLFRTNVVWVIMLAIAALIEIGIVALAVLSLKNQLAEIDEEQEPSVSQ